MSILGSGASKRVNRRVVSSPTADREHPRNRVVAPSSLRAFRPSRRLVMTHQQLLTVEQVAQELTSQTIRDWIRTETLGMPYRRHEAAQRRARACGRGPLARSSALTAWARSPAIAANCS